MQIKTYKHHLLNGWTSPDKISELDSTKTLAICFFSPDYKNNLGLFSEIKSMLPDSCLIGCSTAGEIYNNKVEDTSLIINLIKFDDANLKLITKKIDKTENSFHLGQEVAIELNQNPNLKGVLLLSDGLITNGTALVKGLNDIIDSKKISVVGGLAGDGSNFQHTLTLSQDKASSNQVVAVGLYGENLYCTSSSASGWDIFGIERKITKSAGNILYELDNRPALDLYKEYLGQKARDLPSSGLFFPIQINTEDPNTKLVRTLLAINENDRSMTFAGDMPQGQIAQLMKANYERLIDGSTLAADESYQQLSSHINDIKTTPSYTLAVSCVGRRLVLGERTDEELSTIKDTLGHENIIGGFYSYGEIASQRSGRNCMLHNQSMSLMTIFENKKSKDRVAA